MAPQVVWTFGCTNKTFDGDRLVREAEAKNLQIIKIRRGYLSMILCTQAFADRCEEANADIHLECIGPSAPYVRSGQLYPTYSNGSIYEYRVVDIKSMNEVMERLTRAEKETLEGDYPVTVVAGHVR